jgi:hypothetical protein
VSQQCGFASTCRSNVDSGNIVAVGIVARIQRLSHGCCVVYVKLLLCHLSQWLAVTYAQCLQPGMPQIQNKAKHQISTWCLTTWQRNRRNGLAGFHAQHGRSDAAQKQAAGSS